MTADLSRGAALLSRLIPAADRDAIVGDLLEDACARGLAGARRDLWLCAECGTIAAGLSLTRLRGWLVLPPMREVVSGLALDGRGAWRHAGTAGATLRVIIFCGSIATIAFGVELLVSTLLAAF